MKKTATLLILVFITSIILVIPENYIHVSGNTFTMPQDNKENNQYHTYNIENNKHKPVDKKTNNKNYNSNKDNITEKPQTNKNQDNYSQENNTIHNYSTKPEANKNHGSYNQKNNTIHNYSTKPEANKNHGSYSKKNNTIHNYNTDSPADKSYNNSPKTQNNNYNNTKNKIKKSKPAPGQSTTHIPDIKTISPAKNTSLPCRQKICKKKTINTITKIEFQKHFIKIAAGSCEDILFTTVPSKNPGINFVYKSTDNSIATFKNKKLTGIKKGFTTILIMLPDGTVKAACPVKII